MREKERKGKKKSFLWFIYDAMKVCWTHQNMQQWSYCQGRWSVFIVDWANERGEEKREREKIRGRERRVAILQKGVNHLISTAPPHSPQNGYFVPSDGRHQAGGPSEPPLSHLPPPQPILQPQLFLIFMDCFQTTLPSGFLPAHFLDQMKSF